MHSNNMPSVLHSKKGIDIDTRAFKIQFLCIPIENKESHREPFRPAIYTITNIDAYACLCHFYYALGNTQRTKHLRKWKWKWKGGSKKVKRLGAVVRACLYTKIGSYLLAE